MFYSLPLLTYYKGLIYHTSLISQIKKQTHRELNGLRTVTQSLICGTYIQSDIVCGTKLSALHAPNSPAPPAHIHTHHHLKFAFAWFT